MSFTRLSVHGSNFGDQQFYLDGYAMQTLTAEGALITWIPSSGKRKGSLCDEKESRPESHS